MKGVVSKDHVHMHVEYRPSQNISMIVKKLKGRSPRKLQEKFPELGKRYWGCHFWAIGFGCWSTGNITDKMVNDYLEHHRKSNNEHRQIQMQVRNFMETEVEPIANKYWNKAEFPFEIIPKLAELNICGVAYRGYGCPDLPFVMEGIIAEEIARVDVSISTFFGVHSGLAMGSIYLCGSQEQKEYWLPKMQKLELIGAFGLTEPNVGSGATGGLETTCRKEGEEWILNGKKKWSGNATFADVTVLWARDEISNQSLANIKKSLSIL